jgi:hypothetical protein
MGGELLGGDDRAGFGCCEEGEVELGVMREMGSESGVVLSSKQSNVFSS